MKIAVTGGIGSGKSSVLSMLKKWGARVIDADEINRRMLESEEYLRALEKNFPSSFVGGVFDKAALKRSIFESERERNKLNGLAHPYIMEQVSLFLSKCEKDGVDCFAEIPLLDETYAKLFDAVWLVVCDDEIREKRTLLRDGGDASLFRKIAESQKNYYRNFEKCEVIDNSSTYDMLENKVRKLYCALKKP